MSIVSEFFRDLFRIVPSLVFFKDRFFDIQLIQGRSMEPTLKSGDLVLVEKTDSVQPDDLVVFFNPLSESKQRLVKRVIASRVLEGSSRLYVLGDNAEHSVDSRLFGEVNGNLVDGRVCATLFRSFT